MSEYWKSQPKKYCEFCKCWITDNKVSVSFHEGGKRHKEMVEERLREIRRKGQYDDAKSRKEDEWVKRMEENAMKDYRMKDLDNNSDMTAKIFNEKRAQRDADREKEETDRQEKEDAVKEAKKHNHLGMRIVPVPSTSNGFTFAGPDDKPTMVRKIQAPKEGTKWHNSPPKRKIWFEALSETGQRYFWNTETNESSWTAPSEGFTSIAEQGLMVDKNIPMRIESDKKPERKRKKSSSDSDSDYQIPMGPVPKAMPYGTWKVVEPEVEATDVDFQAPQTKEKPEANVTLHSDRLTQFVEKSTPSLGGASSASKPAIVFRKRKVANQDNSRKREDE